jgi:hypothetical protein
MKMAGKSARGLLILAAVGLSGLQAKPQINQSAQNLSKLLGPSKLNADSGSEADMNVIRNRAIPILNALQKSYQSSGPTPESLIENAYNLRKDVGPYEKIITSQMLIRAWQDAKAMGLFGKSGSYSDRIVAGRYAGSTVVFEHIVPPGDYPAGSTHLANFRIVAPDQKREAGAPLTAREEAFKNQLANAMTERERGKTLAAIEKKMVKPPPPKVNAVGQTKMEADKRWKQEVDEAGELANQMPSINIEGRVTGTPSHLNKNRWRVATEIQNRSSYPTEVEVEYWLVGITEKKRDHYLMAKGTKKLQLRRGEEVELEFFTKAESTYKKQADDHDGLSKEERQRSRPHMRGIIIRVNHAEGVAATFASDRNLIGYVDDDDPMTLGSLLVF